METQAWVCHQSFPLEIAGIEFRVTSAIPFRKMKRCSHPERLEQEKDYCFLRRKWILFPKLNGASHSELNLANSASRHGHRSQPVLHSSCVTYYVCDLKQVTWPLFFLFKILFIYFLQSRKGGRKRGRETSMCGCLLCVSYWGPGLQPRHVPWLGIQLAALWFKGWHSIHWTTPAREYLTFLSPVFSSDKGWQYLKAHIVL